MFYDTPGLFKEEVLEEVELVGGEARVEEARLIEGSNVLWMVVVRGGAGLTEGTDGDESPPAL